MVVPVQTIDPRFVNRGRVERKRNGRKLIGSTAGLPFALSPLAFVAPPISQRGPSLGAIKIKQTIGERTSHTQSVIVRLVRIVYLNAGGDERKLRTLEERRRDTEIKETQKDVAMLPIESNANGSRLSCHYCTLINVTMTIFPRFEAARYSPIRSSAWPNVSQRRWNFQQRLIIIKYSSTTFSVNDFFTGQHRIVQQEADRGGIGENLVASYNRQRKTPLNFASRTAFPPFLF